jgi:peptidoglycan hydrolase-like protein with peptidoglycan-binding domain
MFKVRNFGLLLALSSVAALPACSWFGGGNGNHTTSSAGSRSSYSAAQQPNYSSVPAQQPLSADTIRQVQQTLQQQGIYHSGVDGVWGPRTEAAVRSFQQKNNINPTGQLDQPTLASLNIGNNQQNYGNNSTNQPPSNQASDNGPNGQPQPTQSSNQPPQLNAQSNQQNGNTTR